MSKDAIIFMLDVSSPLTKIDPDSEDNFKLNSALDVISLMLQQKIIDGRKTDAVSIITLGNPDVNEEDEQESSNLNILYDFQAPNIEVLRFTKTDAKQLKGNAPANILASLGESIEYMLDFTHNKKYDKKIFIISSSQSELGSVVESESMQVASIRKSLMENEINLDIILVDDSNSETVAFYTKTLLGNSTAEENEDERKGKDGVTLGSLITINEALDILRHFMTKRVRSSTLFRGDIEIGTSWKIPIFMYAKTAESRLPSAKKLVAGTHSSVARSFGYTSIQANHDDEDEEGGGNGDLMSRNELIKAYKYGKTLIPFHKIDEEAMAYYIPKSIVVIGFVSKKDISRETLMGPVLIAAPEPENEAAEISLSSLARALYERDQVALVRYVRAKNSPPKLGAFFPMIKPKSETLMFVSLPFSEDVRRWIFPSLETHQSYIPNSAQLDAMDTYINSMNLCTEENEYLKPKEIFNPTTQRFFQCLIHRIFNPTEALPPVAENIKNLLCVPEALQQNQNKSVEKLFEAFTIKKVTKESENVKRFWLTDESLDDILNQKQIQIMQEKPQESQIGAEAFKKLVNKSVSSVGSSNPVADFKAMAGRADMDLVEEAINQMIRTIKLLVDTSFADRLYQKAFDCVIALREVCIKEDEVKSFNDFMTDMKIKFANDKRRGDWWKLLMSKEISLITSEESTDAYAVSIEESKNFIVNLPSNETALNQSVDATMDAEDLADLLE